MNSDNDFDDDQPEPPVQPAELHALRKHYQQMGEHDPATPGSDAVEKNTPD